MENFKLDTYFGNDNLSKCHSMDFLLQEKLFHIKDLGLNQRNVMHWDNYGLINLKRDNNDEWRKFSFLDYVWLHTIQELRTMGVPLSTIKKASEVALSQVPVKPHLESLQNDLKVSEIKFSDERDTERFKKQIESIDPNSINDSAGFPLMLVAIAYTIELKSPVSMLLFHDGECMFPWFDNELEIYSTEIMQKKLFETHVVVSISNIIRRFLSSDRSVFILPKLNLLEKNEQMVMDIINSGDYEMVKIKFKNKKIKELELTKNHDTKRKIVDVLSDAKYQDIEISRYNGAITKIKSTHKINL